MYLIKICLFSLIFNYINSSNTNPGVVLSIKPKLINDIKMKFLPQIMNIIREQDIGNVQKSLDIVIGKLQFSLTRLHLSIANLNPQNVQIDLRPPNRCLASVRDLSASIRGSAEILVKNFIHDFSINSDIIVSINNLNIDIEFSILRTPNSSRPDKMGPSARIEDVRFIGNLDIKISLPGAGVPGSVLEAVTRALISFFNDLVKCKLQIN